MIPDILVSKYLDGDLSIEEDMELRKRTSEDPSAKEAFDAAILIHIAMSCADPFEVPDDVRKDTLAAVFTRIEASAAPMESIVAGRTTRMSRPLTLALALFLLISIPVGELLEPSDSGLKANVAVVQEHDIPRIASVVVARPVRKAALAPMTVQNSEAVPAKSEGEFTAALPEKSEQAEAPSVSKPFDIETSRDLPTWVEEPVAPSLAVVLGTYVGAGIGSSDPSLSSTTIIAQSIGYKVGSNTIIGLEFGSLSFANAVSTTANISNRDPSSVNGSRISDEGGNTTKLQPALPYEYTKQSLRTTQALTRIWGTAFLQQSLFRTDFGELQAKAGFGGDEVGLMGFGRLTAQFRVQKWLSISVGAEARSVSFVSLSSAGTGNSSSIGFLMSAVAGIQITP